MTHDEIIAAICKPLVWGAFDEECLRSDSVLGRYEIMWGFYNGQTSLDVPDPRGTNTWHPTLADAKAAAEAHYRARIAAALDIDKIVALVKAATPYVSTVGNADFARQMREYEALVAALTAFQGARHE